MSCNNWDSRRGRGDHDSRRDSVADVVKDIVKAQHRAVEAGEDTCFTSCDQSIGELISPFEENRDRLRHNTIPFILFCKENCKPFIGSGARRFFHERSNRRFFDCVESPILRAKSFVGNSRSLVRLELLLPIEDRHHDHSDRGEHGKDHHEHRKCDRHSVCDFFPEGTHNFRATGICITVDLNCFCAISCLDPITPRRARDFDEDRDRDRDRDKDRDRD